MADSLLDFEKSKILAIVGAVVSLLGGSGHAWLSLLGVLAYLLGMYGLSAHYGRPEIFRYAFMASIGVFAAALVIGVVIVAAAAGAAALLPGLGFALLALLLVVLYAAALLMGKYKRDLMRVLGEYSDRSLADLAGKLYWWGAVLTIILVGLVLLLLASLLEVIVLAALRRQPAAAEAEAPAGQERRL